MSLRQVLSIYNAERQLNEDDTALLHTLRRLKDGERELLVQELSDKPQKKSGKKSSTKSGSKSQRASGMASAISNSLESSRKALAATDDDGGSSDVRCQFVRADGRPCHLLPDHNIHHLATAAEHHEFVAGKSDAQSAAGGL